MFRRKLFMPLAIAAIAAGCLAGLYQDSQGAKSARAAIRAAALRLDRVANVPVRLGRPICAYSDTFTVDVNHLVWSHRLKGSKLALMPGNPSCRFYTAPHHTGQEVVTVKVRGGKLSASRAFDIVHPVRP